MLKIDQVSTFYGKIQVLKEVSIQIAEGEIVAVIGANGAGKTTTLRTISGLLRPVAGQVEFLGKRIDQLSPEVIAGMGIAHVPEGGGIFRKMTVLENLELGSNMLKDKEITKRNMNKVFERFPRLAERKKQLAGTLSGGERQMLAIGRAMMSDPKLYLFDEPSLGLSPVMVRVLAEMISRLKEEGATVLLVEQNAVMALNIADRGYVLEVGRVIINDLAKSLLNNDHVRRAYLGI